MMGRVEGGVDENDGECPAGVQLEKDGNISGSCLLYIHVRSMVVGRRYRTQNQRIVHVQSRIWSDGVQTAHIVVSALFQRHNHQPRTLIHQATAVLLQFIHVQSLASALTCQDMKAMYDRRDDVRKM